MNADEGRRDPLQLGPLRRRDRSRRAAASWRAKVDRQTEREVETFHLRNGRKIYLLGQGRLVNLACAEGHPAQVMDMSFATQAMAAAWAARRPQLEVKVHNVPLEIEDEVAAMKLAAMGIRIDRLSADQKHYLASWQSGT